MNVALTGLPWQHVSCGLFSCFDYSLAAGELGKQVLLNGLSEGKYVCPALLMGEGGVCGVPVG